MNGADSAAGGAQFQAAVKGIWGFSIALADYLFGGKAEKKALEWEFRLAALRQESEFKRALAKQQAEFDEARLQRYVEHSAEMTRLLIAGMAGIRERAAELKAAQTVAIPVESKDVQTMTLALLGLGAAMLAGKK